MAKYWNLTQLDLQDKLNERIWAESPAAQQEIQRARPPGEWEVDAFGTQQIMRGDRILPWVPDILGRRWRDHDALMVVGIAYAGFIRRTAGGEGMCPDAYAKHETASSFLVDFVGTRVPAEKYYRNVRLLLPSDKTCERLVLTDLCRACFVRRGPTADSSSKVAEAVPNLFAKYVESTTPASWLWERVESSGARVVVALGTVAEHGLLRLFHLHGASVRSSDPTRMKFQPWTDEWTQHYAGRTSSYGIRHWTTSEAWWNVTLGQRRWRVVPIQHVSHRKPSAKAVELISHCLAEAARSGA